jgi:hypothetical protein
LAGTPRLDGVNKPKAALAQPPLPEDLPMPCFAGV